MHDKRLKLTHDVKNNRIYYISALCPLELIYKKLVFGEIFIDLTAIILLQMASHYQSYFDTVTSLHPD